MNVGAWGRSKEYNTESGNGRVTYTELGFYLTGSQVLVCSVSKIVFLQITP